MALNLRKPAPRSESDPGEDTGRVIRRPSDSSNGNGSKPAESIVPLSSRDIMDGAPPRELILLAGKDSVGKTCAIVSLACYVELINPDAKFFVLDSENKFRNAMRSFGDDAPNNVVYYKTSDMKQATKTVDDVINQHRPGDWLAVESMSRIWERAQDLGYQAIAGMVKAEYMERRAEQVIREGGKPAPLTPQPDQLWSVTKGAHDGAFLDRITQCDTLNVILTTTLSRPPKEGGFMKENAERRALRLGVGIDAGLEGAPRLPR